ETEAVEKDQRQKRAAGYLSTPSSRLLSILCGRDTGAERDHGPARRSTDLGLRSRTTGVAGRASADAHGAVVLLTHWGDCEPVRSVRRPDEAILTPSQCAVNR